MRGSKIGRLLGFFGSGARTAAVAAAERRERFTLRGAAAAAFSDVPVYSVEGIVMTHAHFWLLVDMLVVLAGHHSCAAGLVKRAVEALIGQPKLSPDVATPVAL